MSRTRIFTLLALSVPALALAPQYAAAQGTQFTVRIENVSKAGTLKLSNGMTAPAPTSPGIWTVQKGGNPLFTSGKPAGEGIERQAEEGNPSILAGSVAKQNGIAASSTFTVPVGETKTGPLLPGKAYEFTFTATPGMRLALATMFAQSNDLFYAPGEDGIALFDENGHAISKDITSDLSLWDAGTEVNQEPGLGVDQAPRQKAPNTGAAERGVVRLVSDGFTYPAVSEVIRVTISSKRLAGAK
jgi:hypothetical protein